MTEQKKLIEEVIELIKNTRCTKLVATTYDQELMQAVKETLIEEIQRKYQDGK